MRSRCQFEVAEPGRPYWWDDGAPLPELPDAPPGAVDLAIVGAGFTGLSAAITAAREGASVCVLEEGVPGEGASTRNGGMAGAHPRLPFEALVEKFGHETAQDVFNESPMAFDFVRELIGRENIDCDLQLTGRIQLAWTRADFEAQKKLVAKVADSPGLEMEILSREQLAGEIRTGKYFGGILFRGHAGLHPRKFHDGLLRAALRHGVSVVANCRVEKLIRSGDGFAIETPAGRMKARKVILAMNGYVGRRFSYLSRRVFSLPSFLIATEKLAPEMIAELVPGQRMMVETRARHSYFRISPDSTRIIFGGRASMVPTSPRRAAHRLAETMCEVWPALEGTKLTHSWSGKTGYTFNHTPHVGCHEGAHYSCGYSGSGVAMAPYLGMKVAYQALGDPRGETVFSRTGFATRPYHIGGRPWFLYPGEFWYRTVVDRLENRAAAMGRSGSNSAIAERK